MKEMSDLICGKAAVGGNYNSTRDSIFLIKYRVELILFVPFLMGLFCYYFWISFKEDSAAQRPEKLFREKGLMVYVLLLMMLFILLMFIQIPGLEQLTDIELIRTS